LLTVIFLVITISPLAIVARGFVAGSRTGSGESSGECEICNCSPERRATHKCCCWQKKPKQERQLEIGCCQKSKGSTTAFLTKTCKCRNNRQSVMWDENGFEFLPYHFIITAFAFDEGKLIQSPPGNLSEHTGEPPVPPHEHAGIPLFHTTFV